MSVRIIIEGNDPDLVWRVLGQVCAMVGECPPQDLDLLEPVVLDLDQQSPRMRSIVIYATGALYTREVTEIDKPYPWLWAVLERLFSSRLYEALRVGYSRRNVEQAQKARRRVVRSAVPEQLAMDIEGVLGE